MAGLHQSPDRAQYTVHSEAKRQRARNSLKNCRPLFLVGATRFERATSCSQSRRSSQAELRPDSHRRDAYTCEQVCWERRLSDLFDDRRTRRVANKTRSRKVHSAVFFRGRQERPKSSSHGPKVRSEIAFFTPKTPCFSAAKPRSREGTALPSPKITRQSSGSILSPKPRLGSDVPEQPAHDHYPAQAHQKDDGCNDANESEHRRWQKMVRESSRSTTGTPVSRSKTGLQSENVHQTPPLLKAPLHQSSYPHRDWTLHSPTKARETISINA